MAGAAAAETKRCHSWVPPSATGRIAMREKASFPRRGLLHPDVVAAKSREFPLKEYGVAPETAESTLAFLSTL